MWSDNETNKDFLGFQVHAFLLKEVVLDPTINVKCRSLKITALSNIN